MQKISRMGMLSAGALVLCACGESVTGEWETTDQPACGRRGAMNIEEDLKGVAMIPIDCLATCEIDVQLDDLGGDHFDLAIEIKTPNVCVVEDGRTKDHYECTVERDGTRLDCGRFFEWKWDGECNNKCGDPDPPLPNVVCADYTAADCPAQVCTVRGGSDVRTSGGVASCMVGPAAGTECCSLLVGGSCTPETDCENVCSYCD